MKTDIRFWPVMAEILYSSLVDKKALLRSLIGLYENMRSMLYI